MTVDLRTRIPYKLLHGANGQLSFRWLHTGDHRFTEPFFDESIGTCMSLEENHAGFPVTTAEALLAEAERTDAVEPAAFIFHVSRCGSTLLAQLLSLDERCIVLSEAPLLDELLRLPLQEKNTDRVLPDKLFRATLRLYGRKVSGKEKYLFVKCDSWHTLLFDRIRAMYPHTPALLLYRSPQEVLRSQQQLNGMHAIPGLIEPELFGFEWNAIAALHPAEYLVKVLEAYFRKYLEIAATDALAFAVNYHDGVAAMPEQVEMRTGISFGEEVKAAMLARTKNHSKNEERKFEEKEVGEKEFLFAELQTLFQQLSQVVKLQGA